MGGDVPSKFDAGVTLQPHGMVTLLYQLPADPAAADNTLGQ